MQTGVITPDNLSHVLRQLSQRRRQGILEIKLPQKVLQIVFMSGRVIEAIDSDYRPIDEVITLLKDGQYIPEGYQSEVAASSDSYKELLIELGAQDDFLVDEKVFSRAVRCRVLEKLYKLDVATGAYYSFKVQMVDAERDFLPSVSVGQLLLDLVALEDDSERFSGLFAPDCWIEASSENSGVLSEEEEAILELCEKGLSLEELRKKSLLSTFHFQDAMLSLKDRELIQVLAEGSVQAGPSVQHDDVASGSASVEDMLAALDQSIDDSFAEAEGEMFSGHGGMTDEQAPLVDQGVGEGFDGPRLVEDENEEFEDEDEWAEPSIRVRMNYMNMKMLHSSAVPHVIVLLFLMCAVLIPVLRWGDILAGFGGF